MHAACAPATRFMSSSVQAACVGANRLYSLRIVLAVGSIGCLGTALYFFGWG